MPRFLPVVLALCLYVHVAPAAGQQNTRATELYTSFSCAYSGSTGNFYLTLDFYTGNKSSVLGVQGTYEFYQSYALGGRHTKHPVRGSYYGATHSLKARVIVKRKKHKERRGRGEKIALNGTFDPNAGPNGTLSVSLKVKSDMIDENEASIDFACVEDLGGGATPSPTPTPTPAGPTQAELIAQCAQQVQEATAADPACIHVVSSSYNAALYCGITVQYDCSDYGFVDPPCGGIGDSRCYHISHDCTDRLRLCVEQNIFPCN